MIVTNLHFDAMTKNIVIRNFLNSNSSNILTDCDIMTVTVTVSAVRSQLQSRSSGTLEHLTPIFFCEFRKKTNPKTVVKCEMRGCAAPLASVRGSAERSNAALVVQQAATVEGQLLVR